MEWERGGLRYFTKDVVGTRHPHLHTPSYSLHPPHVLQLSYSSTQTPVPLHACALTVLSQVASLPHFFWPLQGGKLQRQAGWRGLLNDSGSCGVSKHVHVHPIRPSPIV